MRALVLSGGGAKGAFEAGVVSELAAAGRDYDLVIGVSTGALGALVLAQDDIRTASDRLLDHYWSIRSAKDIYSTRSIWGKIRGGLYSPKPLHRKIQAEVDRGQWQRKVYVGIVDMRTGAFQLKGSDEKCFADYVLASCSFPPCFPPVKIYGRHYMDGGLRNIAPIQAAIDSGASTIDLVLASPEAVDQWDYTGWTWDIAGRAITIATNEVYRGDLSDGLLIDIQRFEPLAAEWQQQYGNIPYIGTLEFDPEQIHRAIEYGRFVAQKLLSP